MALRISFSKVGRKNSFLCGNSNCMVQEVICHVIMNKKLKKYTMTCLILVRFVESQDTGKSALTQSHKLYSS